MVIGWLDEQEGIVKCISLLAEHSTLNGARDFNQGNTRWMGYHGVIVSHHPGDMQTLTDSMPECSDPSLAAFGDPKPY